MEGLVLDLLMVGKTRDVTSQKAQGPELGAPGQALRSQAFLAVNSQMPGPELPCTPQNL